jgi:RNA polymerase sigma-70 factor, ECF subfamily
MKTSSRLKEEPADQAVIRLLFERYGAALLAYTTGLTGSRSAAEDIVQETMLRAWRHAGSLPSDTWARHWLMKVARNLTIDRARSRATRPVEVSGIDYMGPVQADHADPITDSLDMQAALRALPAKHRQVLIELYYKDRTLNQAAEHLGIPVGTVKSRAYHALRNLRAHLERTSPALAATAGPSRPAGAARVAKAARPAEVPAAAVTGPAAVTGAAAVTGVGAVAARVRGAAASAARTAARTAPAARLGGPATARR